MAVMHLQPQQLCSKLIGTDIHPYKLKLHCLVKKKTSGQIGYINECIWPV